ncbi:MULTISPECIES: cobalamin-independent methionine synthase II family protein [unclassified Burkholderia]|uniref:cobalamin-independent methionine synthase II family protein n=1 Tax=unclassified Burkholderia TaxID=2613784 RepID=UPI000F55AFC1|nr:MULTISPECIES: cobalamin-independent methionine synthase II family protein [unclassified Burkholderia]RQR40725.1 epoxyalkane--coenzyme M transferase [Burkholderia sp. Bp9142]RQR45393.1 epoxyalkane--coenzyme M transferase [Burkholderia sp. Bp9140]
MKTSSDRILTTHVGSLPRPLPLEEMLYAKEMGTLEPGQASSFPEQVVSAVAEVVKKQADLGVSIIDDGEMSKYAYSTYARNRLSGLTGANQTLALSELTEFPNFARRVNLDIQTPACIGPIAYRGEAELQTDIANFKSALANVAHEDGFMNASSPGIMAHYMPNRHYPSHEAYLYALADAMKHEYDAIVAAGLILQVDCPDLALGRHFRAEPLGVAEFRNEVALLVEVLNHALRDIPPDRVRMHLCWGNYESPHHHDIDLHEIFDLIVTARPMAILLEAANPRHAHEWSLFRETPLPDDKIIVPGVIDTCTNYIEHREVVAQRIQQYADLVGRERVIAGTDCGFASLATMKTVDPDIAWKKLEAMVQGAEIASARLWRKAT